MTLKIRSSNDDNYRDYPKLGLLSPAHPPTISLLGLLQNTWNITLYYDTLTLSRKLCFDIFQDLINMVTTQIQVNIFYI